MFLTGTLAIFGSEIESVFSPQMRGFTTYEPADFGAILDNARHSFPDSRPITISRPPSPWIAAPIKMRGPDGDFMLWANPANGELQGTTSVLGFKELMRRLHVSLMVDRKLFLAAVTSLSLLLCWQILSGLYSHRKFWREYTRLPKIRGGSRSNWGGLHRWLGVWCLPVVVVSALTGVFYFAEAIGFNPALPRSQNPIERAEILPSNFDGDALNDALRIARSELSGLDVAEIYLPKSPTEGLAIRGDLTANLVRPRANTVTIDLGNSTVLGVYKGEDLSLQRRLTEAADPLHFGTWGGQVTRFIWFLGGTFALFVALSGLKVAAWRIAGADRTSRIYDVWRSVLLPIKILIVAAFSIAAGAILFQFF
ncbi:PepSY domain-containing protein [Pseudohalocynthiibacter sp. F2068]|nr:PepSY domain-containing protein [Pseudohalocynthiibacter sp. F2068]